ncbi:MAG: dihydrofolate reductase family protein, partial [Saccharopolyspora sp.]|uniref:bifunctional diaminohydroxyphosphoribosylaminopyrimidine deaminase/5-amino-6-(5-phosphoribosylamino)uracil reductase RibD n=1 Tax=Saccharopolyspora sp. TaxID=33915 RepID=UPI0025F8676B
LIAAGVVRVVIASEDAFQHEGGAIARMRAAGIAVESGLMRSAARELNRGFFSRVERGRPWLRVKLAMSLDGRTALSNGESKWITGKAAREDVQYWRARSSAILTGSGTVLADDPRLTLRLAALAADGEENKSIAPLRVVLDRELRTPRAANVLDGSAPTLVISGADDPATPPEHGAAIADGIGDNARLEVLPHAAHLANVERAADFDRLLTGHLAVRP